MIVEARAFVWPPTTMHYHRLSSTIIYFELVQILHDSRWKFFSFDHAYDSSWSFSVNCLGNHRLDGGQYFLKCFTVHAEHFVVSGSLLHSQFVYQFLQSAFVSPFDPFPYPCSPTLSRFSYIPPTNWLPDQAAAIFSREKFILVQVFLKVGLKCCGHIVAHDVSWVAQTRKNSLRTQNVSEQNQKHFLCPGHNYYLSPQLMLRARANAETFVSATMCPQQCVLVCPYLYGTPSGVHIFTRKELWTRCSRDFACTTAGELSSTVTNIFGRLTMWMTVDDSWWLLGENRLSLTIMRRLTRALLFIISFRKAIYFIVDAWHVSLFRIAWQAACYGHLAVLNY